MRGGAELDGVFHVNIAARFHSEVPGEVLRDKHIPSNEPRSHGSNERGAPPPLVRQKEEESVLVLGTREQSSLQSKLQVTIGPFMVLLL